MTVFTAPVLVVVKTTAIVTTAAACTVGAIFGVVRGAQKLASKLTVTAPKVEIKQSS